MQVHRRYWVLCWDLGKVTGLHLPYICVKVRQVESKGSVVHQRVCVCACIAAGR